MILMNDPAFQGYSFKEQVDTDQSSVMMIKNETGEGSMRCLDTFSGITLSYNSLRMKSCYQQVAPMDGFISLNYCREGCFQVTLKNGSVYFLGEGDIVINDPGRSMITDSQCPTGIFEGFTIIIEIEKALEWIKRNASWADVAWLSSDKIKNTTDPVTLFANKSDVWHLAEGFYNVLAEKSQSFRITKVLELLELISAHIGETKPVEYFSPVVTKTTEDIYSYLSQNPTKKITVDELCAMFAISKTSLQCCFKSIYGTTPASYIRSERMKYAAQLIISEADKSIGEIASEIGYDNASKFSAAFRAVMNECPLEYRKRNICNQCGSCSCSEKTE